MPPAPPKASKQRKRTPSDKCTPLQDSFEDASDITPRPELHTERSQSRSRSLISKRESTETTAQDSKADSPADDAPEVPEVPGVPTRSNDDAPQTKGEGEGEATESPSEDAPAAKSPLLTAHRISVTSDMDDVSLEEGTCTCGLVEAELR